MAEGWIASPGLTHAEARSQADIYRERCAAYGRQPNAVALRRDIYVGESSSEAQAVLRHALSRGYRGIPAEALIAGSVDEVAEQFRTFEELGYTDILVRQQCNAGSPGGSTSMCLKLCRGDLTRIRRPCVGDARQSSIRSARSRPAWEQPIS
jgi:hypothetical protein